MTAHRAVTLVCDLCGRVELVTAPSVALARTEAAKGGWVHSGATFDACEACVAKAHRGRPIWSAG